MFEDCNSLEDACRLNHFLCAEKFLMQSEECTKIKSIQNADALVTGVKYDSYEVVKVANVDTSLFSDYFI